MTRVAQALPRLPRRAASVLLVCLAAVVGLSVTGCALDEEQSAREAAYPVGYTPPAELPAGQASAGGAAAPQPLPAGVRYPAAPQGQEVVIEDGDTGADAPGGAAAAGAGVPGAGADEYADSDPAALSDFRSALDPYGSWSEDPTYGTVWVPSSEVVGQDFTPYVSAGHWAYDDDYVWVSDYDWGWAPFHYGRWVYGGASWEWIPGRVYSGAWVSWRYGVGDWAYVGWAPLAPLWCWRGGVGVGLGFVPYAPYGFVPSAHLFSPGLGSHLVTGASVGPIASHTQPWGSNTGRVAAHPSVNGPPPSTLHIQSNTVVRATGSTTGIAQAKAFAHPSTAVALGARAPQTTARFATSRVSAASGGGRSALAYAARGTRSYSLGSQSHFGGKLGAGFSGSAASAAPARSYTASARSGPSSEGYRSSAPAYGGAGSSYHSSGGFGAPSAGARGYSGGPSFHGGGGGGFSSGGGGGFHGGGGGGRSGGGGHGGGGHR